MEIRPMTEETQTSKAFQVAYSICRVLYYLMFALFGFATLFIPALYPGAILILLIRTIMLERDTERLRDGLETLRYLKNQKDWINQ